MTVATADQLAASAGPENSPAEAGSPAGALLARVFDALDRDGLPYCVLHGYETYPHAVPSDVDCLVPREMLPRRLGELLRTLEAPHGARVVQWFEDRAHFIVLAGRGPVGAPPTMLQLHVGTDYDVDNQVIFSGDEVLRSRRRFRDDFWVPAADVEFASVLANRLAKGAFKPKHLGKLSSLWAEAPAACRAQLEQILDEPAVRTITTSAESGSWDAVVAAMPSLRKQLLRKTRRRGPLSVATRWVAGHWRRAGRWLDPQCGLHVVFLGPDGVGKSTVIEAVQSRVAPAFLRTDYQTFARGILPTRPKASPHALPPRSFAGSLLKAAWWLGCYTLGYFRRVHPTKARGGLVINHRYLLDAIVDPKRYRYAGPMQLLRWIWAVAPKPDLVIFLDAPAEVIQQRKQEVPFAETARMRDAYLALAKTLPNPRVIDAAQAPEKTIDDVTETLLNFLAARVARQQQARRARP